MNKGVLFLYREYNVTQMTSSDLLHTDFHSLPLITLRIIDIGIAATPFPMQFFNSAINGISFCNNNCTHQVALEPKVTSM